MGENLPKKLSKSSVKKKKTLKSFRLTSDLANLLFGAEFTLGKNIPGEGGLFLYFLLEYGFVQAVFVRSPFSWKTRMKHLPLFGFFGYPSLFVQYPFFGGLFFELTL